MAKQNTASNADQTPQNSAAEADQAPDKSAALEKQLADVLAENEGLKSENGQLKGQVISLTGDRNTLADANLKLQADLEEKTSELELAEGIIEQQTGKLAAAEISQAEGPVVVTHEKEQYRVLVPRFSHAGNLVEARSLHQNPELVRQMVLGGSGLLQKVEPKPEPAM